MPSSLSSFSWKRSRRLLAALWVAGFSAPVFAATGPVAPLADPDPVAAFAAAAPEQPQRLRVAQSREAAQLQLELQQLQEQLRVLRGQVEGLQFQMTQMQTLMQRTREDNEFRFQALENGGIGNPPAATESGGVAPAEEPPQQPAAGTDAPALPDDARLAPGDGAPMDMLGNSRDPLVGAEGADATLGTLPEDALGAVPLDLSLDTGAVAPSADARAQYQAGYDAMVRGDYAFAEEQFQQFVALYPDDPQAPDATNWLGEALIHRGAYDDAALVLAEGYQRYQDSQRAPDLMLKLGIALYGAGEVEVACRTYLALEDRYTDLSAAFRQRLADEKQRAQCTG